MKKLILTIISIFAALGASAEMSVDSVVTDTAAVKLKEIEVQAKMYSTSAEGSTYIPSARKKKSAMTGIDLLMKMGIPELAVRPNGVKTISGGDVSLFVDYLPAAEGEIEGMLTEDVLRVEVLNYPSDPRFNGAPHVVNFIMRKYEYGGYTKLMAQEEVARHSIFLFYPYSKFSYKNMTFDISANFKDLRSNHTNERTTIQRYSINDASGNPADVIRQNIPTGSRYINDVIPVSLRAVYSGDKVQISNTVGFAYKTNPHTDQNGEMSLSSASGSDYSYWKNNAENLRKVSWSGNYYFNFSKETTMSVSPTLEYFNIKSYSDYKTTLPNDEIINNARENNTLGKLDIFFKQKLGTAHSLSANAKIGFVNDNINYSGTSSYYNKFRQKYLIGGMAYTFRNEKWYAYIDGGVASEWLSINDETVNDVYPYTHMNLSFSPNRSNSIRAYLQYANNTPGLDQRSPNVQQLNEFMYITGDPNIENTRHITASLSYMLMPSKNFNIGISGDYKRLFDRLITIYDPYLDGYAVLRRYANNGDYSHGNLNVFTNFNIIPDKLYCFLELKQNFYRSTGYYDRNYNPFSFYAYIGCNIKNFQIYFFYDSEQRSFDSVSGIYSKKWDNYCLAGAWNKDGWKISLGLMNFFRNSYNASSGEVDTPIYSTNFKVTDAFKNRYVAFNISYTFRYGKKVHEFDEVKATTETVSGILN